MDNLQKFMPEKDKVINGMVFVTNLNQGEKYVGFSCFPKSKVIIYKNDLDIYRIRLILDDGPVAFDFQETTNNS